MLDPPGDPPYIYMYEEFGIEFSCIIFLLTENFFTKKGKYVSLSYSRTHSAGESTKDTSPFYLDQ